jgi:Ni/Fe-hydrogenase subunit HybB-like protein
MVHGELWTIKEFFTYPNEYIYWPLTIVMYPFVTGLVAGAFVLSSLYHVFGVKQLKDIARFSLVFSFALLPVAMMPLLLHLTQPFRGIEVMLTPHFTSAIAAFGVVFSTYGMIVASELWFVYRKHFVQKALELKANQNRNALDNIYYLIFSALTLGAYDISEHALEKDEKAVGKLAAIGIPVACFLHGYVGFIFGSVKANALWTTPLMPVIFLCSAVVSGVALCIVTYVITVAVRNFLYTRKRSQHPDMALDDSFKDVDVTEIRITTKYLVAFLILAFVLESLDMIFRVYTGTKSWDILQVVIFKIDFVKIFVLQYGIGNILPFILLLLPGLTVRRALIASLLVLFGVFMMRWNVVIGGQLFSASYSGFMEYHLPVMPVNLDALKEGLIGTIVVAVMPYVLFFFFNKVMPVFGKSDSH